MKNQYLVIITIVFQIILTSCSNTNYESKRERFNSFLANYNDSTLPFSILNMDDFNKYSNTVYVSDSNWSGYIPNPKFKMVDSLYFSNFLKSMYPRGNLYYLYLYKFNFQDYIMTMVKQCDFENEEYWIKLNSFNEKGVLLDTLTIAGLKVEQFDKYCELDTSNIIKTRIVIIPTTWDSIQDVYIARQIKEQYILLKNGMFKKVMHKEFTGKFKEENNKTIYLDE